MGNREAAKQMFDAAVKAANDRTQPTYLTHAYHLFSSACAADPTYGLPHYQAGNNNSDLNHTAAAIAGWRRALECDGLGSDRAKVLANIGWRLHSLGRTVEAIEATQASLKLDPKLSLSWVNMSLLHGMRDEDDKAVEAARKALALDPTSADTNIAVAFALLFAGQYAEGLKFFEHRFRWRLHNYQHLPYPKWEGEPGKTIYLAADQGLGDTLSYARFVERVCSKAQYVHMCVQPELIRLFQHAFVHLPNINIIPFGALYPQADAWTTFVSLPYALKLTDEEIRNQKHIDYPHFDLPKTWKLPDRKLHIGVSWAGSPLGDIDKHRNFKLEYLLELYRVPGIQLYSLQVGPRAQEADEAGGEVLMRNLAPYIRDVCDTLSLLRELDLVICCESALGHITGLSGKECWIPYSYQGRDYRLGNTGQNTLWYPKHRVFRQGSDSHWEPVFERVVEALREKVG